MSHSTKTRHDVRDALQEIISLYQAGFNTRQIAIKFSTCHGVILKLLRKNAIKLRSPHKRKGIEPWNKGKPYYKLRGEKNPRWKGGITNLNQKIRHCVEYKIWCRGVMKRDDYICQFCKKRGGNLEVDHFPKRFSDIMVEHSIDSYEKARSCAEMWDLKNGRTLCVSCHNSTKAGSNKVARPH